MAGHLIADEESCILDGPVHVHYDINGIVGVRLVDPGPRDVSAVSRAIGPPAERLQGTPDITIRFVDRLRTAGRLRRLGATKAAFTNDAFLVVRGRDEMRPTTRLPLAEIGSVPCELSCVRGAPGGVPLLVPIINLTALGKGWIPLHASAFVFNGVGAIAAGWAGGGKTGTLLAFMAAGALYVGDDWVYVAGDGSEARGLPGPLEIKADYLDELPLLRARVASQRGSAARLRTGALRSGRFVADVLADVPGRTARSRRDRLQRAVARRSRISVRPEVAFGAHACPLKSSLDTVFLMLTHDESHLAVASADSAHVARRLSVALEYEWLDLLSYYVQFRFAFPDARNSVLEQRAQLQEAGVSQALAGKPAYIVSHPSRAPVRQLFQTLSPLLERVMP